MKLRNLCIALLVFLAPASKAQTYFQLTVGATPTNVTTTVGATQVEVWQINPTVTFFVTDPVKGNSQIAPGGHYTFSTALPGFAAISMPTSAILSAAESTTATGTCTGLTTSDSIICTSSVHITGVTGFVPSANGILTITIWPSLNTINASYINNTAGSITPGALTINCGASR